MAAKADLFQFLAAGLNDPANGEVYSGALVAFYESSTSTGKEVWNDRDKSSSAGTDASLDSNGQLVVFGDGLYDVKIFNSDDVTFTTPTIEFLNINISDSGSAASTLIDPVFQDGTDTSKQASFSMSGISSGTTRTFSMPNESGTILTNNDILDEDTMTSNSATKAPSQKSVKAYVDLVSIGVPIGTLLDWPVSTVPNGFFERDGSELSMTTYEDLYDVLGTLFGKDSGTTVTFSNGTDTATSADHGLEDNDIIEFSNSGGALPAGISEHAKYFVINKSTNTFQISTTLGGSALDFTTDGTGTNSFHVNFKLMDDRGLFVRWWDHGAGVDPDAASRTDRGDGTTGDAVGTEQASDYKAHYHTYNNETGTSGPGGAGPGIPMTGTVTNTSVSPTSGGNETRPINRAYMPIIRGY